MEPTRAGEHAGLAEPRRPRVQPLLAVDGGVKERVEEIESGDPERDGGAEHPRLPRQVPGDRGPRTDRRKAVDGAEPEVGEPCEPLQVWVDHEAGHRDRPQPADERVELPDRGEKDGQRGEREGPRLRP